MKVSLPFEHLRTLEKNSHENIFSFEMSEFFYIMEDKNIRE